ncbi:MAG TPA: anti-sigma factor [Stellaceae bacterium]|jgi:anti-sigma factor RsiW|nr:anti-sigma factor [Stellaceae bacterium]
MECENILLVQAEFDGELDAAEALRAAQHRQSCAECRDAYAQLSATHALMRESAPRHQAPENLRRAIHAGLSVTAEAQPSRRPRSWWRESVSFGLGAALAAGMAFFVIAPAQQNLLDDVVASHVRALQPGHLEDVISTDQHTVKPWFDGRVDFAPPVKDLAAKQFPLLGGRLDYLNNRPVAALVYGSDKHLIDLYVWPVPTGGGAGQPMPSTATRSGYNTVHWSDNGMEFWAVSDLEAGKLSDFVRLWRASG